MKKVLGLIISQRKLGNSELLVKEIMRSIPFDCNYELIRLTDMNIQSCTACYACLNSDNGCALKDDFNFVMNKINQSDALIIGVPVYLLGPQGCYKVFSDRLVAGFKYAPFTAGKPCIVVVPYGVKGWEGYTKAASLVMPRLLQMKIIDFWPVYATLPGESLMDPANIAYANNLAKRLFKEEAYTPGKRECPYCGSDLFRLHEGDKIECPLCGVEGKLQDDNLPCFPLTNASRFTRDNILEHFDGWVRDMKKKFHKEKAILKEIQKAYRDMDWWIKP